jgi:tRNA pseudouridine55 synthase
MIFNLYKYRGETPLECMQRFKESNSDVKGEKMTYFGRLDPMAEGVLLIGTGDDVKRKDEFLGLDKEYDFTALFGFSTDTYDILGKILRVERLSGLDESYVMKAVSVYEGEREQKYPPFSSRTVGGRALHEWARMEELDSIDIPSKKITVHKMQYKGVNRLAPKELLGRLLMDISKVKGDFRQHEALVLWKEMLTKYEGDVFICKFSAHVSTGTYVRSIVNDLGNTLGIGACALTIVRTRVGDHVVHDSIK